MKYKRCIIVMLLFMIGAFVSLIFLSNEKNEDRIMVDTLVFIFFMIGACVSFMVLIAKERMRLKKEFE